jgi:hypothetical protein
MADASYDNANEPPRQIEGAKEFPWQRLVMSLLFAFVAYWALIGTLILAAVLWVLTALNRDMQPEFQRFVGSCARYVGQCLAYVAMQREDAPFPVGPWPRAD